MRLMCSIVTGWLRIRPQLGDNPDWINRHIGKCKACRKEAEAYTMLGSILRESAEDTAGCRLTWEDLSGKLDIFPQYRSERQKLSLVPVTAGAFAALTVIVSFYLMLHSYNPTEKKDSVNSVQIESSTPFETGTGGTSTYKGGIIDLPRLQNKTSMADNRPDSFLQADSLAGNNRIVTTSEKHVQREYNHQASINKRQNRLPDAFIRKDKNDKLVAEAPKEDNYLDKDSQEVTVVVPEEHVIDVVGVDPDSAAVDESYDMPQVHDVHFVTYKL